MANSSDTWFFLLNSNAGGGGAEHLWSKIQVYLKNHQIEADFGLSKSREDAQTLVNDALMKGHRRLVAVGGDGTINSVVHALFSQSKVNPRSIDLGAIPIGTGNDWARTHGLPKRYKRALQILLEGKSQVQDIGQVRIQHSGRPQVHYFNNVLGLCFDSFVVEQTQSQSKHGILGQLFYLLGVVRCLRKYTCPVLEIRGEGFDWEGPAILANIGICQYSGGGMRLVPKSILDDGLFDITVVEAMTSPQVLRRLRLLYNGNLYNDPQAHHFRSRWVEVKASPSSLVEVDGELIGSTPIRVEILPSALSVISSSQ